MIDGADAPEHRADGGAPVGGPAGRSARTVASLVVVLFLGLGPAIALVVPPSLLEALPDARVAAVASTLLLTLSAQIHWKATGQSFGAYVAGAGWTWFVGALLAVLVPEVHTSAALAASIIALSALSIALTGPDIDPRLRPWKTIGCSLGAFAALTVLLSLSPVSVGPDPATWALLGSAWWAALAWTARRRSQATASALVPWLVPMAVACALADSALAISPLVPGAALVAELGTLAALLVGTYATIAALASTAIAHRLEVTEARAAADAERRARDDAELERAHDVRTAILAIEGATATLRRHRSELDQSQRAVLDAAIAEGFRHLRGLATAPLFHPVIEAPTSCDLAAIVRSRVTLLTADGVRVRCAVDEHVLEVRGSETDVTRIVDNLLSNALLHGRRGDRAPLVAVHVARRGHMGVLWVDDDGPGVARGDLERVFASGHTTGGGEGLGLAVSRRLARTHLGDVTLSDSVLGGASAQLQLPTTDAVLVGGGSGRSRPIDVRTDLGQDGIEVRQVTAPSVGGRHSAAAN